MKKTQTQILIITILIITISTLTTFASFIFKHEFYRSDFKAFYSAAQILKTSPHLLYDIPTQKHYQNLLIPQTTSPTNFQVVPYLNPPIFLVPYILLTLLTPTTAYFILTFINLGEFLLILLILNHLFKPQYPILMGLISFSFAPVYYNLFQTQSSITTLLIFISVYYLITKKRHLLTGMTASLLLIKPPLAFIVYLYLLSQKNLKIFYGLITGSSLVFLISYLLSPTFITQLPQAIINSLNQPGVAPNHRITWLGFFSQLEHYISIPIWGATIICTCITIILFLKFIHQQHSLSHKFSLLIITTLLSIFHAHYHELVLLVFIFYANNIPNKTKNLLIATTWTLYLFTIFPPTYPYPLPLIPTIWLLIVFILLFKYSKTPHPTTHS